MMSNPPTPTAKHGLLASEPLWRKHAIAFVVVNAALIAADRWLPGTWWSFWVLFVWGVLLAVHFFFMRSVHVDEDWADERAENLRIRSYDVSHIEDIGSRIEHRDASVSPGAHQRRPSPPSD